MSRSYKRSQIDHVAPVAAHHTESEGYSRKVSSKNYSSLNHKKRRHKKILVTIIVVAVALVIGGGAAAMGYLGYLNNQIHSGIDDMSALNDVLVTNTAADDPFYVLLLGTDQRVEGEADRSDTIILARVDEKAKQVVMISIPRDTYVDLGNGYGYGKINAAHAYGGAAGAVSAVEKLTGVQISHYAEINFNGFKDLVNALGGVEVDVPITIDDYDAGGYVEAGLQTLDGDQALVFCRSRDFAIGDYQRQADQRIFLQALASKVLSSDPATLLNSINSIAAMVSTDMNVDQIYSIANSLRGMDSSNIYTYTVPSTPETIDGSSVVVVDETEWKSMMATIDAGGLPETQSSSLAGTVPSEYTNSTTSSTTTVDRASYTLTVRNGGGIEGSATSVANQLTQLGYVVSETGNTTSFVYDKTLVVYNDEADLPAVNDIISQLGTGTAVQSEGRYTFTGQILVVVGSDWSG